MRATIYYATNSVEEMERIREKYGFPRYTTINGEQEVNLSAEELKRLKTEENGLIEIRRVKA